jgi:hypothetical protein
MKALADSSPGLGIPLIMTLWISLICRQGSWGSLSLYTTGGAGFRPESVWLFPLRPGYLSEGCLSLSQFYIACGMLTHDAGLKTVLGLVGFPHPSPHDHLHVIFFSI